MIPPGAILTAPALYLHRSREFCPNVDVFDGFLFSRMNKESRKGTKHQKISTGIGFPPCGHGKHAW
jgi:hypothetical protein